MEGISEGIANPRGRVKSCTSCRQVKLRCDAVANFPSACTRCQIRGQQCRIDSNFKRVSVRGRLEEMSRKVNNLQNSLGLPPTEPSAAHLNVIEPGPGSCTNSSRSVCPDDWVLLSDMETNRDRTWCIGDVLLNYENVSALLSFYSQHYYPHLPIFDRVTSISELHDSSPLLFWTILRVSCYRHPTFYENFKGMSQPYQALLSQSIVTAIRDFRILQALVVLCYWPNSGRSQSHDPSWQYCGIAVSVALQMGLDQPNPERLSVGFAGRSNVHQMSFYTRQMTWLACFHINTSLSVWLGLSPHISSPAQLGNVTSISKGVDIPSSFTVQTEIQRQIVHYSNTLAGDVNSSVTSTLLGLFNDELSTIAVMYKNFWSTRLEVQLLGAKLYLFSLCLTILSKHRGHRREPDSLDSRILVQLGLPTAVSLIHNISKLDCEPLTESASVGESGFVVHYPKFYFRLTMFAVAFLLKFLCAYPKAAQEDRELAVSHITVAHQFFSSFPRAADFARVAEVIGVLVRDLRTECDSSDGPIKTRLGASLLYDTMKQFRGPPSESRELNRTVVIGEPIGNLDGKDRESEPDYSLEEPDVHHWSWSDSGPNLTDTQDQSAESPNWIPDDMLFEMLSL